MQAKIIGVMRMRDDKGEDDKLVAVSADDPDYADISDISEMPPHRMRELKRFFEDYKALEHKKVLVREPQGRAEALEVLRAAIRLYDREADRLRGDMGPAPQRRSARPEAGRGRPAGAEPFPPRRLPPRDAHLRVRLHGLRPLLRGARHAPLRRGRRPLSRRAGTRVAKQMSRPARPAPAGRGSAAPVGGLRSGRLSHLTSARSRGTSCIRHRAERSRPRPAGRRRDRIPPRMRTHRASDFSLEFVTDALRKQGILREEDRKTAFARENVQRAKLLREQRPRAGGRALRRADLSPVELLASFAFSDARREADRVDEDKITKALAEAIGLPYVKIDPLKLDVQLITRTLSRPVRPQARGAPARAEERRAGGRDRQPLRPGALREPARA